MPALPRLKQLTNKKTTYEAPGQGKKVTEPGAKGHLCEIRQSVAPVVKSANNDAQVHWTRVKS